jgi:hypothetical protein
MTTQVYQSQQQTEYHARFMCTARSHQLPNLGTASLYSVHTIEPRFLYLGIKNLKKTNVLFNFSLVKTTICDKGKEQELGQCEIRMVTTYKRYEGCRGER